MLCGDLKVLVTQLCLTLCYPMNYSLADSSVDGILQARILEYVALSFSRGSSQPGIEPGSPAFQADSDLNGKEIHKRGGGYIYIYIYIYISDSLC